MARVWDLRSRGNDSFAEQDLAKLEAMAQLEPLERAAKAAMPAVISWILETDELTSATVAAALELAVAGTPCQSVTVRCDVGSSSDGCGGGGGGVWNRSTVFIFGAV